MGMKEKEKYELKKLLKELSGYRGRHTELVTVYVPAGYDLNKITTHLAQEQGTASNIKSTATRKNVTDALEKMIQHLKNYTATPKNGLAVFSGNVAQREGQSDVKVWSLEPPFPLNIRLYRCDKAFVLDQLYDMMADKEVYGLIVLDRRDAIVATLTGKTIKILNQVSSNVPGKTRAGGQSAARYGRLREDAAKDFYKKIADMVQSEFLGNEDLKGLIVGGPGPTKYEWVDRNFLTNELKKKIIGIKDCSYTGEFGLQELLEKSEDLLANEGVMEEKKVMQKFFEYLATKPGMVAYGYNEVKKNLEMGSVEKVLVSDAAEEPVYEELEELAEKMGSELMVISTETREGVQLRDIGKIAAILRYDTSA